MLQINFFPLHGENVEEPEQTDMVANIYFEVILTEEKHFISS